MAEENKHMDDAFKRMSEEFKVSYNPAFWDEAAAKLDDALLDDAFKAAAAAVVESPSFEPTESVDDLFMDSAFVDAASSSEVSYDSSYFEQFIADEGDIAMDEAFTEAANAAVANYLPEYWSDADTALQNEGLHYEYHSSYWQEAKALLDRQDRAVFFTRWSAIAAILMLISFTGNLLNPAPIEVDGMLANNENSKAIDLEYTVPAYEHAVNVHESLMADKELGNYTDLSRQLNVNNNQLADNFSGQESNVLNNTNEQETNTHNTHSQNVVSNDNEISVNDHHLADDQSAKTKIEDFASTDIQSNFNEINKATESFSLTKIGSKIHTPIQRLGYERPIPEIEIHKPEPTNIHTIGILAETGIGNRWGNFSYLPTMRNSFGIEYLMSSGKNFPNFEFGGNLKINHVRQTQLGTEERSSVYDKHGEVTKYWRKLQLKDMVYANLNGVVNYRVAPVHKLKFGLGIEYLSSVRSNMSYRVDNLSSDITTVNNNWGVKEGLNKFDMRLSIGYEFEVSNRFAIQFNSSIGLFDRTDNEFMKDIQSDREINLMMGLKYNFVKLVK